MKNKEEQILRYVNNLEVSKEFLDELENNKALQIEVTNLKNDLFIMEKISDSYMFKENTKKAEITFKDNIVESFSMFFKNTPLLARGDNIEYKKETYISGNVEININDNIIYLNIKEISKQCIIKHNDNIIINTSNSNYSTHLNKEGTYTIIVDDKEYIIIKK